MSHTEIMQTFQAHLFAKCYFDVYTSLARIKDINFIILRTDKASHAKHLKFGVKDGI